MNKTNISLCKLMILNDTGSILLEKIMFGWNEGVNFSISTEKIIKLKSNRFNLYPHSRSYSILLIKMVKTEFRWRRKRKTVSFFGFVTLTINFLKLEFCWVCTEWTKVKARIYSMKNISSTSYVAQFPN